MRGGVGSGRTLFPPLPGERGPDQFPSTRSCQMIVHHAVDHDSLVLPERCGSSQAALRHPKLAAYRCFLPDLTGFAGLRRVEPGSQRQIARQPRLSQASSVELRPAVADCGYRAPLAPRLARSPQCNGRSESMSRGARKA